MPVTCNSQLLMPMKTMQNCETSCGDREAATLAGLDVKLVGQAAGSKNDAGKSRLALAEQARPPAAAVLDRFGSVCAVGWCWCAGDVPRHGRG